MDEAEVSQQPTVQYVSGSAYGGGLRSGTGRPLSADETEAMLRYFRESKARDTAGRAHCWFCGYPYSQHSWTYCIRDGVGSKVDMSKPQVTRRIPAPTILALELAPAR
jgi:hypothetical protein